MAGAMSGGCGTHDRRAVRAVDEYAHSDPAPDGLVLRMVGAEAGREGCQDYISSASGVPGGGCSTAAPFTAVDLTEHSVELDGADWTGFGSPGLLGATTSGVVQRSPLLQHPRSILQVLLVALGLARVLRDLATLLGAVDPSARACRGLHRASASGACSLSHVDSNPVGHVPGWLPPSRGQLHSHLTRRMFLVGARWGGGRLAMRFLTLAVNRANWTQRCRRPLPRYLMVEISPCFGVGSERQLPVLLGAGVAAQVGGVEVGRLMPELGVAVPVLDVLDAERTRVGVPERVVDGLSTEAAGSASSLDLLAQSVPWAAVATMVGGTHAATLGLVAASTLASHAAVRLGTT